MDKGTFFFAMKCGSCHPGDQALKYDRSGYKYWDGTKFGYQYAIADGKYTGPIVDNGDGTYANVKLDGDYGFIVPPNRLKGATANDNKAVAAPWSATGVIEADCMLCHSAPRLDPYGNNYSWMDRSAALGAQKFAMVPNATMGWTDIIQCQRGDAACDTFPQTDYAKNMMPMNFPPTMANWDATAKTYTATVKYTNADGTLKAGLVEVNDGGNTVLALVDGAIQPKPSDANCQGCHAFPDIKKSGKLWMPGHPQTGAAVDAHIGKVGCVGCHPSIDGVGHNFAKGDATIGNVRNDLDNVGFGGCVGCHDGVSAPDPMRPRAGSLAKANHTTMPPWHFTKIACQSCHVPYVRWAFHPVAQMPAMPGVPMPMITDVVYDMATSGTQLMYPWAAYLGDDPLDASVNRFQMGQTPTTYAGSYKWYPAIKNYKGKFTTVKAALSAWFGEWLPSPSGDLAIVKPLPLRLVRKGLTSSYGQYTQAQTDFNRTWIRDSLLALRSATDVDTGTTFVSTPVLVKAGLVYYLDASDNLAEFESAVAETHDFGLGHEVVPLKSTDPARSTGPYGTGGCADCHAPDSSFFYGQQLEDFNFEGTGPRYEEHYAFMGYSDAQVAQLAGAILTVRQVDGNGTVQSDLTGKWYDASQNWVDTQINCGAACAADFSPPKFSRKPASFRTVTLTAAPEAGRKVKGWTGCDTVNGATCTVVMNASKLVYVQYEQDVFTLTVIRTGTGSGTVSSAPVGTPYCANGTTDCQTNTIAYPAGTTSVVLTATAASGSRFIRWMGCPSASANTCTVNASGALVYAVFDSP